MPRIRTYENKTTLQPDERRLRPSGARYIPDDRSVAASERAAGAFASLGQAQAQSGYYSGEAVSSGLHALAGGVEQVERHIAQNETGKLAADFATAQAELTTQWNAVAQKADPNDHEVASRFLSEVVSPRLEKLGDGLLTPQAREMYQKAAAGLRSDLFVKTSADQATLAGQAAIVNLDTVKNQLSQTVRNDPSGFRGAINLADLSTEGLVQTYGLPRDKALVLGQQVREEIAKSAFIGMADKNPSAARAILASGEFNDYFDGTTAKTMDAYAEAQLHSQRADARAQEAEQRRQDKERFDAASAAISASIVNPQTGAMQLPPDYFSAVIKLAQLPQADAGQIRSMISAGHAALEDQAKGVPVITDANTYENFSQRMLLSPSDPNALTARDVYQARSERLVSDHDMSFFLGGMKKLAADPVKREAEKQFNFFLQSQKSAFTGTNQFTGFRDPKGDNKFYAFATAARQQFEAAYSQGGDQWKKVLQPGDPNFLGRNAAAFLTQKGAQPSQGELYGTVQSGYRFVGHTAAEWSDKNKWQKVGQ